MSYILARDSQQINFAMLNGFCPLTNPPPPPPPNILFLENIILLDGIPTKIK